MFKSISVGGSGNDALVIGHFQGEKPDEGTLKLLTRIGAARAVETALSRADATGETGVIIEAFPSPEVPAPVKGRKPIEPGTIPGRVLIVGLGKPGNFSSESVRHLAGVIGRRLAAGRIQSASIDLSGPLKSRTIDPRLAGVAFGEGLGLLGWVCDQFRGPKKQEEEAKKRVPLAIRSDNARFQQGLERGLALAVSTNYCRTLSQTPPNIATTQFIADEARKLAKDTGLVFKEWIGEALEKERFTGLINVGKASENKPRMIRLEYRPEGAAKSAKPVKPVVLIGKTMTYDSGGLSLKINNGMVGMKRDKDGGCAVLGAMHAIASVIKPKVPVVAFLAVAENSISDEAYRPDDILTYRNGVTVEITNTDAEGRLVLADALAYACEKENPACIVDLATLTGGVVVALGSTFCGMFCEDDALRGRVERAAGMSGERVWRLPLHSEYRDMMKSPVADILNSNAARKAHPIQGAAFLSYFVEDNVPWCHLDIAGVHVAEKNAGPYVEGPTGWGVRLLANFVEVYPAKG